jgi:hypothetical protein
LTLFLANLIAYTIIIGRDLCVGFG